MIASEREATRRHLRIWQDAQPLLARFRPRRGDARELALQTRVLLLEAHNDTPLDVALGAVPFEVNSTAGLRHFTLAKVGLDPFMTPLRRRTSRCRISESTDLSGDCGARGRCPRQTRAATLANQAATWWTARAPCRLNRQLIRRKMRLRAARKLLDAIRRTLRRI